MPRLGVPPFGGRWDRRSPRRGAKRNDVPPGGGLCDFVRQVAVERGAADT
jgi:hypothetical protein